MNKKKSFVDDYLLCLQKELVEIMTAKTQMDFDRYCLNDREEKITALIMNQGGNIPYINKAM